MGAGNALRNIIESEWISVIRLTRIFRQTQSGRIVMSAHDINKGVFRTRATVKQIAFFFIQQEEPEHGLNLIRLCHAPRRCTPLLHY